MPPGSLTGRFRPARQSLDLALDLWGALMAVCVQADGNGVLSVVTPQPVDISTCTYLVIAPGELNNSPFSLSISDAHEIGMSLLPGRVS